MNSFLYKKPLLGERKKILGNLNNYEKKRFGSYLESVGEAKSIKTISQFIKKEHGIEEKDKFLKAVKTHYAPPTGIGEEQKERNIKISRMMSDLGSSKGSGSISKRPTIRFRESLKNQEEKGGGGAKGFATAFTNKKNNQENKISTGAVSNKAGASPSSSPLSRQSGISFPK